MALLPGPGFDVRAGERKAMRTMHWSCSLGDTIRFDNPLSLLVTLLAARRWHTPHVRSTSRPVYNFIITARKPCCRCPRPIAMGLDRGLLLVTFVDCPDVVGCRARSTPLYRYLVRADPVTTYTESGSLIGSLHQSLARARVYKYRYSFAV